MTRVLNTSHGLNREAFAPRDWALFSTLSTIWGASFLFMEIGLRSFHPGLVTLGRVGFGALFMLAVPRARRTRLPRSEWPGIVALAVLWVAVPLTIFPIAQQWIDSGVAGMLNGATPILTAVVAAALLRQLPGRRQMAGLLIGFTGIVLIGLPSAGKSPSAALGVILVLVATICYAFASNIVAPLQQRHGALPIIARVQWTGALLVAPFGIYGASSSSFSWGSLAAVMAVGILGTGLAFVLMSTLIGSVGPTRATFITYVIPVIALVLGMVFLGESISPMAIVGIGLVIAGAAFASRREI